MAFRQTEIDLPNRLYVNHVRNDGILVFYDKKQVV